MTEKKEKKDEKGLEDFKWDDDKSFFGTPTVVDDDDAPEPFDDPPEDPDEPEPPKPEDPEDPPKPKKKEKKKPETDDDDPPEDPEDPEEPEEPEPFSDPSKKEDDIPVKDKEFFKILAGELKEAGVFVNVEIDEDAEITEETFIELQDQEIESRVQETFEAFFEELDDDAREFLKFKKDGGDTRKFFGMLKTQTDKPTGDLTNVDYQKKFLHYYYKTYEEMDEDDIDNRIEWLEDSGNLSKYATKYDGKVKTLEVKQQEKLNKQLQDDVKTREKDKVAYQKKINTVIQNSESIGVFPITKKDKLELGKYLTKPVQKIGKNAYISQFQADMNEIGKNPEKLVLLAKLVKQDFDIGDVERKVETKKVTKLKEKLARQKSNRRPTGGAGSRGKSLSDFFAD